MFLPSRFVHSSSVYSMGIWGAAFLGLMVARPRVDLDIVGHRPGFLFIAGSFGAFFAIVLSLQRHMGLSPAAMTFGRPIRLIVDGPFRYSRNPIYSLFLLPIAALGIYSLSAAFVTATVYVWTMNRFVIGAEEFSLATQFGDDYLRYAAKTPRWLFLRDPGPGGKRARNYALRAAILCSALIVGLWLGRHCGGAAYWWIMSPM